MLYSTLVFGSAMAVGKYIVDLGLLFFSFWIYTLAINSLFITFSLSRSCTIHYRNLSKEWDVYFELRAYLSVVSMLFQRWYTWSSSSLLTYFSYQLPSHWTALVLPSTSTSTNDTSTVVTRSSTTLLWALDHRPRTKVSSRRWRITKRRLLM